MASEWRLESCCLLLDCRVRVFSSVAKPNKKRLPHVLWLLAYHSLAFFWPVEFTPHHIRLMSEFKSFNFVCQQRAHFKVIHSVLSVLPSILNTDIHTRKLYHYTASLQKKKKNVNFFFHHCVIKTLINLQSHFPLVFNIHIKYG